jgi:cell division protein FtsQ
MSQARPRKSESTPRRLPKRLLIVAGLLVGTALIGLIGQQWLSRIEGPAFETLVIRGERHQLTAEHLRERVRPTLADGYFGTDLGALQRSLEADPWIASVSVRRQWPSTLELTVHEQRPVAVWNRSGFLNEQAGFFVPREMHSETGPLPELSGPEGTAGEVLAAWRTMQEELTADGLRIDSLALSDRRAWTLELADGPSVRLGRGDRAGRFRRLARVALPAVTRSTRVSLENLEYIDMRYTNGFSVATRGADHEGDRGNG